MGSNQLNKVTMYTEEQTDVDFFRSIASNIIEAGRKQEQKSELRLRREAINRKHLGE